MFTVEAAVLLFSTAGAVRAEDRASAGVVTTLNGEATITRAAAPQPVALRRRDDVFVRDQIRTEPRSLVRVLLGGKALITVRELSVLRVTEEAGRVTVDLTSGKIGVAVVKARMRPGAIIEIRSANAIAAVRGTVFVVEVDPAQAESVGPSPTAPTTRVHLLHGALDVSSRYDPAQAVRLAEMQTVDVSGNTLGPVQPLSQDAVAALTADLQPREAQSPAAPTEFTDALLVRGQAVAVGLAASLPGVSTSTVPVGAMVNTLGTTVDGLGNTARGAVSSLGAALGGTVGGVGGTVGGTVGGGLGSTVGGLAAGGARRLGASAAPGAVFWAAS